MAESSRRWPSILKDPAVASLSSFIGVDGINTTLNSGRILINLKPAGRPGPQCLGCHPPLTAAIGQRQGISLYMQPVQDLTVEDRVSRTQYQYTLEDPDPQELQLWTQTGWTSFRGVPDSARRRHRPANNGRRQSLVIDRVTAARLGITAQQIDNTLYDAFGQRQVSTLFTQLNQYHLIMEATPPFQKNPSKLKDIYVQSANGGGAA